MKICEKSFLVAIVLTTSSLPAAQDRSESRRLAAQTVLTLDGDDWLLAVDPKNSGREEKWFKTPRIEAKQTKVPWIIQDIFPDYHGVAWYWRQFQSASRPDPEARYLLRFWAVDYSAQVWLNGVYLGSHEGGETPFSLDATGALRPGAQNILAVRVLNPADEEIDGLTLKQTPHRNKTGAFTCGCDYDHGGIEDSVELLTTSSLSFDDLFVQADPQTGIISIKGALRNTRSKPVKVSAELTSAPADEGQSLARKRLDVTLAPGESRFSEQLQISNPRLWQLNDPFLYRITAKLLLPGNEPGHEISVRCGFRDFRFENGYFRLNGRRLLLRSSVSGNMSPIGVHVPYDRDWLRRDLLNSKVMGFNAIRFYGLPNRFQLDLCDELGLLVYEEPFSSQGYEDTPQMARRFDTSTSEMILRDRNHPSVVIWGLLNETGEGAQFRHAVQALPLVRALDPGRMVLLSSGRFDGQLGIGSVSNPGSQTWEYLLGDEQAGASATRGTSVPAYFERVGDAHIYPWVPHAEAEINFLRTVGEHTKPVFVSEYGIASAVDLVRVVRQYEQRGKGSCGEALFYRQALDKFMGDWERWQLADCFGTPEDYFRQCLRQMASQRLLGINALRANPKIAGFDITGTADQGYTGEGLTTPFRELKPGTIDALADGLAPLRWCLFAEPVNLYRSNRIKLEALLANEDVLSAGEYPVKFQVIHVSGKPVFERQINCRVPGSSKQGEPSFVLPVFSEEMVADWPAGKYRWVATFEKGGAASGGEAEFYVADRSEMPEVNADVVLWGEDPALSLWLTNNNIRMRPFASLPFAAGEVILIGRKKSVTIPETSFQELSQRIARGATAVFLDPSIFERAGTPGNLSVLGKTGTLVSLPNNVYHKDDWAKTHPIFDGLPAGGIMDYTFYRELISNLGWARNDPSVQAIAGAIYAFTGYSSGLLVSIEELGRGRFVLNTFRIYENLGKNPAADRLLRNLLRWAALESNKPLTDGSLTRETNLNVRP